VDGALASEAGFRLEEHLLECPACRGQAAAERALRACLLGREGPWPSRDFALRLRRAMSVEPHGLDEPVAPAAWFLVLAAGAGLVGALAEGKACGRPHPALRPN